MSVGSNDLFERRHVGPDDTQQAQMLEAIGAGSLEGLIEQTVPAGIRMAGDLHLPEALSETAALRALRRYADRNQRWKSYIGMGYHACITPPVIRRNLIEDPGWYTAYTPYQAEISQGRLEVLLLFQTMVQELTGLDVSNASLLDEGTAAAEAMTMTHRIAKGKRPVFRMSDALHPQTRAVVRTRARRLDLELIEGPVVSDAICERTCGVMVACPETDGTIRHLGTLADAVHEKGALLVAVTDLLACCWMEGPGNAGVDVCVGSSQRFGVPMGFGGPHAAFLSTRKVFQRHVPGRIIGVSKDASGGQALRMALQTREQHIRRHKATSNICTAQVLLAVVAAMYGAWHGPEGLRAIATRVHRYAEAFALALKREGLSVNEDAYFDTVWVDVGGRLSEVLERAAGKRINLRQLDARRVSVSFDETTDPDDFRLLLEVFGVRSAASEAAFEEASGRPPTHLARITPMMTHPLFHSIRSETDMMRYLNRLKTRDLSLTTSMIPLGSCTMKLNAAAEMEPISWPEFASAHPFAPTEQVEGYHDLLRELETWLGEITGYPSVSMQPNAGSQGEYAGLLAIRRYHESNGDNERDICLIPTSAHGTNPASAVLAGMRVVPVRCDAEGSIDHSDLSEKVAAAGERLAALMITYPSTHGVFEERIQEICQTIHDGGGQVYLDGANLNAMVGICRPAELGADVCHLNLHKTFCIPHGGGGPGMGPIGVAAHLAPFVPGHPVVSVHGAEEDTYGPVSAAPWGSASILPITWMYIRMMGPRGLKRASQVAILSANYIVARLEHKYDVLYRGRGGRIAHECILDIRPFKAVGVQADDIAKRLMDFGFHAPTMSWPVVGTLMVEPTESESMSELDRFCDAMLAIRQEVADIEDGRVAYEDSPLRHAPHTLAVVTSDRWDRDYTRSQAAFPAPWTREHKYWPYVSRVDNAFGDRNLVCSCDAWLPADETP